MGGVCKSCERGLALGEKHYLEWPWGGQSWRDTELYSGRGTWPGVRNIEPAG